MALGTSILKTILNVNNIIIDDIQNFNDDKGCLHIDIYVHPYKKDANCCPICGRKCSPYDQPHKDYRSWRALDWNGVIINLKAQTHRIECPEHSVLTASVPWAYPHSKFTKDFDRMVTWLALQLSKFAVSELMRIDWETVGNCIKRAHKDIEPNVSKRLDGLVRIGIDETSYKKGHKYITVIVNHDTNEVVWAHKGHGKTVLEKFYNLLSEEQRQSIEVVTGDGARWITDCVNTYTPDCVRCVDPFHVVEWATKALDDVRCRTWQEAKATSNEYAKSHPGKPGRPSADDKEAQKRKMYKETASNIKKSKYTLGKARENLTDNQLERLMIFEQKHGHSQLYRAYLRKEELRLIFKIKDLDAATLALDKWLWSASHSRIPEICELCKKIRRHKEHILNTIKYNISNARIEATNNKIKLIIRKAYGFKNIENMLSMIYMTCSNLRVPLPNRG